MISPGRIALNLTTSGEEDIADWSPDGAKIVFDNSERIFLASLSGSTPELLVANGDSPMWSPEGGWIAFSRSSGSGGTSAIWLVHPDGADAHRVADGFSAVGWSRDGSHLAILQAQTPSGTGTVFRTYAIVDVGTGNVRTLDIEAADTAGLLFRWPAQAGVAAH